MFLVHCFLSSSGGFFRLPGSEAIQLDLEKLLVLAVSKEHLDFSDIFVGVSSWTYIIQFGMENPMFRA